MPETTTLLLLLLIGVLLLTGVVSWQYQRREQVWRADVKRLSDIKYALDQAAIVATTDVTGRITDVNDRFCDISGYARDELIGQDHRVINSRLHPASFIRDLWHTIAGGHVWHGEIRNRAKDGHYYWVDTTIVPFLDGRGKPYQYTAIRSDITQRKAAEERLREQAALARVGQMAAVVAHEVKNPLAGIKGVVQVLLSRRPAADPERAVMTDIVSRIDALNDLIQDLMLFARPRPLRLQSIDVAALVRLAADGIRKDPAATGIAIDVVAEPIALEGDAELLQATFFNVLLNAVQALKGRGAIHVRAQAAAGGCEIAFVDDGPGITESIRERVLEPFFTTKSRGGGLGLPIARRTVELHGGSLALEFPAAGGTTVRLLIPLQPPITHRETADAVSA